MTESLGPNPQSEAIKKLHASIYEEGTILKPYSNPDFFPNVNRARNDAYLLILSAVNGGFLSNLIHGPDMDPETKADQDKLTQNNILALQHAGDGNWSLICNVLRERTRIIRENSEFEALGESQRHDMQERTIAFTKLADSLEA